MSKYIAFYNPSLFNNWQDAKDAEQLFCVGSDFSYSDYTGIEDMRECVAKAFECMGQSAPDFIVCNADMTEIY